MNAEQRHQKATKRVSRTAVLFFSLIVISAAIAQLPTATVLGVVKDSSGAVMPKANLTARNVETGQTRTTVASGDGSSAVALGQKAPRLMPWSKTSGTTRRFD